MRFILFGHRVEIAQAIFQAKRCRIGHAFTLSLKAVNIAGLSAKAATNRGSIGRQCRYAFANLFVSPDNIHKRRPGARDSVLLGSSCMHFLYTPFRNTGTARWSHHFFAFCMPYP